MAETTSGPRDLVGRAHIRIRSAALHSRQVMAEGWVVSYSEAPTLLIRHDDGTQSSWPVTLPREVLTTYADSGEFSAALPAPAGERKHDGGTRAAQIQAAMDLLVGRLPDNGPNALNDFARRLVDAVHAAGREGQGPVITMHVQATENLPAATRAALVKLGRAALAELEPSDDSKTWFTTADVAAARQRLADNGYGGDHDAHDLDPEDITEIIQIVLTATWQRAVAQGRDQGEARGYQQAITNARDNDLYRTWWRTEGIDWDEDDWLNQPARRALARYLEAVGPGETGSERDHPGDAISASAHAHHRYAVAFNTLSAELSKAGRFVALSERETAARAMLAAVDNLDRACGRDNPATAAETGQDGAGVDAGCAEADADGSEP